MLARLDVDVLALHPDLVVVMGGTNDLPGRSSTKQIIRRLDLIVDRIERAGAVAVLCTIAPRDRFGSEALALNRAIRRYASRANVPLLDLYDVIGDGHGAYQRGLTPDGVHPNWRAAGLMAVAAERQLRVLLKPVRGQARSGRVP
jgi:lysophospholipase L1-like esterase